MALLLVVLAMVATAIIGVAVFVASQRRRGRASAP
jgi:hypothetical protein